jgi:hypothetical protein
MQSCDCRQASVYCLSVNAVVLLPTYKCGDRANLRWHRPQLVRLAVLHEGQNLLLRFRRHLWRGWEFSSEAPLRFFDLLRIDGSDSVCKLCHWLALQLQKLTVSQSQFGAELH